MPSLFEKTACDGLLPLQGQGVTITECPPAPITALAPLNGKETALGKLLKEAGLGWPKPGRSLRGEDLACRWSGQGQAFVIGALPGEVAGALGDLAAVTDQSDGWARIALEGPGVEAVLARLVPLDLRAAAFPAGAVARSALGHMMALIARTGPEAFEIMVFRSMAATAVHELAAATAACDARRALP